jgi:hypothetical protein
MPGAVTVAADLEPQAVFDIVDANIVQPKLH